MFRTKTSAILTAGLLSVIFTAENAHAYIDPGTGSYLLQLTIAGLLGAGYVIKLYWARLKSFFESVFRGKRTKS